MKYLVVDQFDAIRFDSILLVSTLGILGFLEDIPFLGFGFSAKIHNDTDNITYSTANLTYNTSVDLPLSLSLSTCPINKTCKTSYNTQ